MSKRYYDPDFYKECYEDKCRPARTCDTRQLIQNGGFEVAQTNIIPTPFDNWNFNYTGASDIEASQIAYEGARAFRYTSRPLQGTPANNSLTLTQNVNVTPGCRYTFRFAENFQERGTGAGAPRLTARVYYVQGGTQTNLIETTIVKGNGDSDVNRGYAFHEKTSTIPVPCDVSGVVVEFRIEAGFNAEMTWLLDGVSLQAVSGTSACR